MFGQLVALIEKVDDTSPEERQKEGSEIVEKRNDVETESSKGTSGSSRAEAVDAEVTRSSAPNGPSPAASGSLVGSAVKSTAGPSSSTTYWGGIAIAVPDSEVQRLSGSPLKDADRGANSFDHLSDPGGRENAPSSVAAAVKNLAIAQTKISRLEREKAFLAKELQAAQQVIQHQGALLEQIGTSATNGSGSSPAPQRSGVPSTASHGVEEKPAAGMDPDQLHFEVSSAIEHYRQEQVLRLESLVQFHLVTIAALEESNSQLRSELLQCEMDLQAQIADSRSKGELLAQQSSSADEATKSATKKANEIQSLTLRLSKMAAALQQKDAETGLLREEVDSLSKKLIQRENEIEQMRENSLGMEEVKEIRMFKALDQSPSLWGKGITRAATVLDRLSLKTGTFLKSNARLRLIIALYVIFLHLYVFHVVTSVVHVMPHSADDAHDHLANHIHPGNGT